VRGEERWQSEQDIGLYSWPRSTRASRTTTARLSRNTTTLSRPNTETSSQPKQNIRVVEDTLASREAPEEKGDGEQENESKWGRLSVRGMGYGLRWRKVGLEQKWSAQGGMCAGEEEFPQGFRSRGRCMRVRGGPERRPPTGMSKSRWRERENGGTDLEGPGVVSEDGEIPAEALDSC